MSKPSVTITGLEELDVDMPTVRARIEDLLRRHLEQQRNRNRADAGTSEDDDGQRKS